MTNRKTHRNTYKRIIIHLSFFVPAETFVIDTVVSSSELLSDVNDDDMRNYVETQHIGKHGTIELHNAYIAAGTLAAAVLIVAIVVS